jgi:hypothetical protein
MKHFLIISLIILDFTLIPRKTFAQFPKIISYSQIEINCIQDAYGNFVVRNDSEYKALAYLKETILEYFLNNFNTDLRKT